MVPRFALALVFLIGCGSPPAPPASPPASPVAAEQTFRVQVSGIVCIAAPCPTMIAVDTATSQQQPITDLDLTAVGGDGAMADRIRNGSLTVRGTIRRLPHAGPAGDAIVLVVSHVQGANE